MTDGTLAAGDLLISAGRVIDGGQGPRRSPPAIPDSGAVVSMPTTAWPEIAARAVVLLRNDGDLLPLGPDDSIAVIGALQPPTRYQGGGSSCERHPRRRTDRCLFVPVPTAKISFAPGYHRSGCRTAAGRRRRRPCRIGRHRGPVPPDSARSESKGFDRTTIDLPADQIAGCVRVLTRQIRAPSSSCVTVVRCASR